MEHDFFPTIIRLGAPPQIRHSFLPTDHLSLSDPPKPQLRGNRLARSQCKNEKGAVLKSDGALSQIKRVAALESVFAVRSHFRRIRIHLRTKITQDHQRLGFAQILKSNACFSARLRAEVFVFGQFGEANQLGAV